MNLLSLFVIYKIPMMSSKSAMECQLFVEYRSSFDFPFLYLSFGNSLEILCETGTCFVQYKFHYSLGAIAGKHEIYFIY